MGFFVAGNFYPDYILWIDTPEKQYITFVDPKGLLRIMPDDPKIEFYKTIKDLEKQLAPTAGDKQIVLNSFIMSATKSADFATPPLLIIIAFASSRLSMQSPTLLIKIRTQIYFICA